MLSYYVMVLWHLKGMTVADGSCQNLDMKKINIRK